MADELDAPLGKNGAGKNGAGKNSAGKNGAGKPKKNGSPKGRPGETTAGENSGRLSRFSLPHIPLMPAATGLVIALLAIPTLWVLWVDDPDGGRPTGTVEIAQNAPTSDLAERLAEPPAPQPAGPGETGESPANIEGIEIPEGAQVIDLSDLPDEAEDEGVDKDLLEESQHGAVPRVASDGRKPFEVYARPAPPDAAAGSRVAIVVTGLGLAEDSTRRAIETLPADVTLAFAPYAKTVSQSAQSARFDGHEVMLQIPMEPFDYPENDPGPQTLLTGQPARANLDRLHWLMARFTGYTGLVNYMGARFTASAVDFGPVMEEVGLRGLSYVDDGSSNRSLAPQLTRQNHIPFGRADIAIDRQPSKEAITNALDQLEARARADGSAIGFATALPVTINTLAEWAEGLQDRGITLVPVSALVTGGAS
ncbi:divergent polysaccharide deacetylase family protein [Cucumibacter marinus]|uniref:divergent polysaccharide deacetylase family protein n=1 Tax=Cucumibacter marinus TaxID=1121252 RepID=UPI000401E20F|nr:divergent polysaccharide deacetylase family protein [Cucumibacter marinus]